MFIEFVDSFHFIFTDDGTRMRPKRLNKFIVLTKQNEASVIKLFELKIDVKSFMTLTVRCE